MGRDHGVAGSIEQDPLQGSVALGPRRDVMGSLLGQSPLHGLKQLAVSNVPKLFLKAEPGAILANNTLVNLVRGWPALTEKPVAGIHFVQEDSPEEIGRAISGWMLKL